MIQEYIKMRNTQQYNLNWFYKYFVENNGRINSMLEFQQYFSMINLNDVLSFLDKKFELTTLIDKDNKFIKVIE